MLFEIYLKKWWTKIIHICVKHNGKVSFSLQEWEFKTDRCGLGKGNPFKIDLPVTPHQCGHFPGVFSGHPCSSASSRSCQPCTRTWHRPGKSLGAAQNYKTNIKGRKDEQMPKIPTKFQHHSRLLEHMLPTRASGSFHALPMQVRKKSI